MELTQDHIQALKTLQRVILELKADIKDKQQHLEEVHQEYIEAYPVKRGDIILYHDRNWIVLKIEVRPVKDKIVGLIHLVKPTKGGGIPANRVDGSKVITFYEIGEPKPEKFTL